MNHTKCPKRKENERIGVEAEILMGLIYRKASKNQTTLHQIPLQTSDFTDLLKNL